MILVSLDAFFSSSISNMLQPLALSGLLIVLILHSQRRKHLLTAALFYLVGLYAAYLTTMFIFKGNSGLPGFISIYFGIVSNVLILLSGMALVHSYLTYKKVLFPPKVESTVIRLRQLSRRTPQPWVFLVFGLLVGLIEPVYIGGQQQLLIIGVQAGVTGAPVFYAVLHSLINILPALIILALALFIHRLWNNEEASRHYRALLSLLCGFTLIVLSWLLLLTANSFLPT